MRISDWSSDVCSSDLSVSADFAAAINRAAGNDAICSQLIDARRAFVKSAGTAAEDAAIEAFLAAKAPQPAASPLISLDTLHSPVQVRTAANGERLAATAEDDVAGLPPRWPGSEARRERAG